MVCSLLETRKRLSKRLGMRWRSRVPSGSAEWKRKRRSFWLTLKPRRTSWSLLRHITVTPSRSAKSLLCDRPLLAHCHAGFARLHHRTGHLAKALEQFGTATRMYREMGMAYWLEKAEAEMAELR